MEKVNITLPCKIKETVYFTTNRGKNTYVYTGKVISYNIAGDDLSNLGMSIESPRKSYNQMIIHRFTKDIGKTVFLNKDDIDTSLPVLKIKGNVVVDCLNKTVDRIVIPDGITKIKKEAFSYCINLKEIIIPDSVTCIEVDAFRACYALENVNLPPHLERICDRTFLGCHNLKKIYIPDGVTHIGRNAFSSTSIDTIDVPESVESISSYAFHSDKLKEITIHGMDTQWWSDINGIRKDFCVKAPAGSKSEEIAKEHGIKFIAL